MKAFAFVRVLFVGLVLSTSATFSSSASQLLNMSARAYTDPEHPMIGGFVVEGSAGKSLVMRSLGASLEGFGVLGCLRGPSGRTSDAGLKFRIFRDNTRVVGSATPKWYNHYWEVNPKTGELFGKDGNTLLMLETFARLHAFEPRMGPDTHESAMIFAASEGLYSVVCDAFTGAQGRPAGVALFELYDNDVTGSSRLVNMSFRAYLKQGEGSMIAGCFVGGNGDDPVTVLFRAAGPGLAGYNLPDHVKDPVLTLYKGQQAVFTVDDWGDNIPAASPPEESIDTPTVMGMTVPAMKAAMKSVGAFPFADGSHDAAFIVRLPPGGYTAVATSKDGSEGTCLIEMYQIVP